MDASQRPAAGITPPGDDVPLLAALRAGDEAAFMALVERYHAGMLRLARAYVKDAALAEEVTQEAWLGVLEGIARFEGRSSLKTWIFRILTNIASKRAKREARSVAFSSLLAGHEATAEADPDRLVSEHEMNHVGHWVSLPQRWDGIPEARLMGKETLQRVREAIVLLPRLQQAVIVLRDIEGWEADETCQALHVSQANQRVLLHRARAQVRRALSDYHLAADEHI